MAQTVEPAPLYADIPQQPLAEALAAFARQTGLQLVYVSEVVRGRSTKGVPAGLTPHLALSHLLEGTGLEFEFMNARSVRIFASRAKQQTSQPHAPQTAAAALEEVVVTATAREESFDRVPIQMAVWTQQTMESAGVSNLDELAVHTPGVYYYHASELGPGVRTDVIFRGLVSDVHSANSGFFFDDVPIHIRLSGASNFGSITPALFDLDRVEVLYGPQGTLGGDGSETGALRFFSTPPSLTDWNGTVRTLAATTAHGDPDYEFGAAVGGPIVPETAGFRLSAWTRTSGGYVDRVNPFDGAIMDADANRSRTTSVRGALTLAPWANVRITPSLIYQEVQLHDSPIFYEYLSDPGTGVLHNGKLLRQPADDRFFLGSVRLVADFQQTQLTSITAYAHRNATSVFDATNSTGAGFNGWGNPLGPEYPTSYLDAIPQYDVAAQTALSQEFRLESSDPNASVRWLAGAWLTRSTNGASDTTTPVDPSLISVYAGYQATSLKITQTDAFAQLDVRIADRLRASAGVRFSHTQQEEVQSQSGPLYDGWVPTSYGGLTSNPVAPRFALTYAPGEYGVAYVSVGKGYRLGGFNPPLLMGCTGAYPASYSGDTVWGYEAGLKARSGGGALQLDAAVFHLAWQDIQQLGLNDVCGYFGVNAGAAESDGFDLTVNATISRLHLGAAVEYADARYTNTVHFSQQQVVHAGDALGQPPYVASPWSGTVWIEASLLQTARWASDVRLDAVFHSHNPGPFYTQDPTNVPYAPAWTSDPATSLMNCRASVSWDQFEVSAFVENMFDSLPELSRRSVFAHSTLFYASTVRPRTAGFAASLRF